MKKLASAIRPYGKRIEKFSKLMLPLVFMALSLDIGFLAGIAHMIRRNIRMRLIKRIKLRLALTTQIIRLPTRRL